MPRGLPQIVEHLRPRRLRLFGVGCPKTGTTTVARMFDSYRSGREWGAREMLPLSTAALNGELAVDTSAVKRALRYRSARYHLEVDAANFLTPFAGTLASMYPDAKFVLTIRDCFSWLDSRITQDLRYLDSPPTIWDGYRDAMYRSSAGTEFAPAEGPLRDAGVSSVDAYLGNWRRYNEMVLAQVPSDRLLVLRTEDLEDNAGVLARFAGVPEPTVVRAHANKRPATFTLLAQVPSAFVVERAEERCGPLMERFWGSDWTRLVERLPSQSV